LAVRRSPILPVPTAPPLARLAGVTKVFAEGAGERVVLDGASLELFPGELVVLLGRSGSGKSTLLHLVAGLDRPTAGRVELGGADLATLGDAARARLRRERIGFVFQFFNLVPTLTVEENLLLPLELAGRLDSGGRQRARALLAEVGLGDRARQFPDRLSGGEQQRIAVARALVHEPDLVLADEPTGNLDLDTGLAVLELLDRLTRRAGKALLMVTHGREVQGVADRRLTLDHGHIVELEREPRS
jgi:putative ABC transport system ATP-binding protein